MKYAGIIYDDTAAAPGLCLSFYVQGCPIKCDGCQNPHTWDPDGGYDFTPETLEKILNGLTKNGIQRTLCILGGEPFAPFNLFLVQLVIQNVRQHFPQLPIWIWTGYTIEELQQNIYNPHLAQILSSIDGLVVGPFVKSLRDITLPMRGSSNQKILIFDKERKIWYNKEKETEVYNLNGN